MKSERLLILALLAPGLVSFSQDNGAAGKPAAPATPVAAPQSPAPDPAVPPAPAPASPALPALPPGTDLNTYVIGPSDIVDVSVWKEMTLSGQLLVRPDGMVTLPLLGDVQAAGLTCPQLADQIQTKLKKFVQDPKVSVVLGAIHSKVIYMLGEVGRKGAIEMTPGMTLLQAIAQSGGLSDYANVKKAYLLREEDGKHLKIPLHYKAALKGDITADIPLKPGDTIVVP